MSVNAAISRAKGVAEDGRLHNVRTRHVHLASLFRAIQRSHTPLHDAVIASFPEVSSSSVKLAISQLLKDIRYFAATQDEKKANKMHALMSYITSQGIHQTTVPIGAVAVAAYGIQYNPIAAVFGPLVSAISAGCPCIIFSEDNAYSSQLDQLITSCLDKEAYAVIIGSDASFASAYESFDKVVTFQETRLPNAIHVNGLKSNLVVVDQSLVGESVYRTKGKRPSRHELRRLNDAAHVIRQAVLSSNVSTILVSENVAPFLAELLQLTGKSSSQLIVPCRSTEHIIAELEDRQVHLNGLYIFAGLKQASYLARYTNHKSCAVNCMPVELLTGYFPTPSSASTGQDTPQAAQSLAPLWPTSLFSQQSSSVVVSVGKMASSSPVVNEEEALQQQLTAPAPFMLRRKPKHLEFFPTGFKITAFPTLLTILGLTGYTTFKASLFVYRHIQPHVRNMLH